MALPSTRTQRLFETLQAEREKGLLENRVHHQTTAAKYRSCALGTHDTLPPAAHWTPKAAPFAPSRPLRRKKFGCTGAAFVEHDAVTAKRRGVLSDLLAMKMDGVKKSEWALLDTFEAHMCKEDQAMRKAAVRQTQANTKAFLMRQWDELQERARLEKLAREKERQMVLKAAAKHQDDEASKAKAKREHDLKLKEDTERQVADFRAKQAWIRKLKLEDETEELKTIQRQAELELQRQERKKAEHQAAMQRVAEENVAKIAAKKAAKEAEMRADKALMDETLATLERQERERAQALVDFQEMVAKRGARAGQMAVAEANERAEREDRLMKELEARKEREDAEKEARAQAAREKMMREVQLSRAQQVALKAELKRQKMQDMAQFVNEVKVKDLQVTAAAEEELRKRRAAAIENRKHVEAQMAAKLKSDYLDDIFMTLREKDFMKPLLKQAVDVVKEPKIISATW